MLCQSILWQYFFICAVSVHSFQYVSSFCTGKFILIMNPLTQAAVLEIFVFWHIVPDSVDCLCLGSTRLSAWAHCLYSCDFVECQFLVSAQIITGHPEMPVAELEQMSRLCLLEKKNRKMRHLILGKGHFEGHFLLFRQIFVAEASLCEMVCHDMKQASI